jgi:large subunit ribosomal protein L18
MNNKFTKRLRRGRKTRANIQRLGRNRLCVHKSLNNIYVQLIAPCGSIVVASASTKDKDIKDDVRHGGNCDAAKKVGGLIAARAIDAGVTEVAFDRSGFKFHGRIKALADAAREAGLQF